MGKAGGSAFEAHWVYSGFETGEVNCPRHMRSPPPIHIRGFSLSKDSDTGLTFWSFSFTCTIYVWVWFLHWLLFFVCSGFTSTSPSHRQLDHLIIKQWRYTWRHRWDQMFGCLARMEIECHAGHSEPMSSNVRKGGLPLTSRSPSATTFRKNGKDLTGQRLISWFNVDPSVVQGMIEGLLQPQILERCRNSLWTPTLYLSLRLRPLRCRCLRWWFPTSRWAELLESSHGPHDICYHLWERSITLFNVGL